MNFQTPFCARLAPRFDNVTKAPQRKITLKTPEFDDYAHFYAQRFEPGVVYWADDAPHTIPLEEYAGGRLLAQGMGEIIERIIVLDGEPIGTITARDFVKKTCQCTLGIVIASPQHWSHGYGSEALRLFLDFLAREGFALIVLETYANNTRAQRCFTKLGFRKYRVFYAAGSGRFVVQMIRKLPPPPPIGTLISPNDPHWKPPKR